MYRYITIVLIFFNSTKVFSQDSIKLILYFDFNSSVLANNQKQKIQQQFADTTKSYLKANIYGHTDQIGNDSYNNKLSTKRVNTVVSFLISLGISPENVINAIGFGETKLITNDMAEDARKQNRRVEIVIYYSFKTVQTSLPITPKPVESIPQLPANNITQQIVDTNFKAGRNIILEDILFYGSRHFFLRSSYSTLQKLLETMQQIETLEIEIQGHVCCTDGENDGYDLDSKTLDLSYQRAKAIRNFLVDEGISSTRITYKGLAHKYPLTQERNEAERTRNRRVEMKVIKK